MRGTLTPEALALFLYFVVPGLVLVKVYDLIVSTNRRDAGSTFLDALAYSFVFLAVGIWPYLALVSYRGALYAWLYYLLLFLLTVFVAFVAPTVVAVLYYRSRTKGFLEGRVPDPTPTPWDWFFTGKGPLASVEPGTGKPACYVRFHTKEGEDFGGYFGQYSLASSFPTTQQVYVEEAWRLNEDGTFGEKVTNTVGAVVNLEECRLVEFVAIDLPPEDDGETGDGPEDSGGEGREGDATRE
jgi:hypothetical protein